jgi:Zn-finger nucleic acid-binding protein
MKCPSCKNDMIVVEYKRIELDHCPNCRGVWFDHHELELLLISFGLDEHNLSTLDTLRATEVSSSEKKQKCPICNKKMKKNTMGQQPAVLVDMCHQDDGIWFDGGEISTLLLQIIDSTPLQQDIQQRILGFLGEVFKVQL